LRLKIISRNGWVFRMVDFLIIRNKCDTATEYTNWIGEGMKQYLESKGHSVADLSDAEASPEKVKEWLSNDNRKTMKAVIALDHGSNDAFWGEKDGILARVINMTNVTELGKKLHVYTLACSTNADGGLGERAIDTGCFSWLGYKEPVYAANSQKFKDCIWSYMVAMAEGKTIEECEDVLRNAYLSCKNESFIYQYNLDRMLLRKSQNDMTIQSHNRISKGSAGYATRLDLDYVFGGTAHYLWAVVGGQSYFRLVKDEEIRTVVKLAFEARKVWIESDGAGQIARVRPIND
jgi:hypothetical protein